MCVQSVHGATDCQHAIAVGVKHGALIVQRGHFCNFPISWNPGTIKRQQQELGQDGQKNMYRIKTTTLSPRHIT